MRSLYQFNFVGFSLSLSSLCRLTVAFQPPLPTSFLASTSIGNTYSLSSTLTTAKKAKIGELIPKSLLESEVEVPDLPIPHIPIDKAVTSIQDIQAWKVQAAEDYTNFLSESVLKPLIDIKDLEIFDKVSQVQQWRMSASKDYKEAISLPYQRVTSAVDQVLPDGIKSGAWIDQARAFNAQVGPAYKQAIRKLVADETYAGAKSFNEQAIQDYNSFLTNTYSALKVIYPEDAIAIAIAQQKINNEGIVKGYNGFVTQINNVFVKPAVNVLEVAQENNQVLPGQYKQFVTATYDLFQSVAIPVAQQTGVVVEAAKAANANLTPQYKKLITALYQPIEPVLSAASDAVGTVSERELASTRAAQADAVIAYNRWITESYALLKDKIDETVGPALEDIASKVQDQLDEVAAQITNSAVGLPGIAQSLLLQASDDFSARLGALAEFQNKLMTTASSLDVSQLGGGVVDSASSLGSVLLPTVSAQVWAANAAVQYQQFIFDAAGILKGVIGGGIF